MQPVALQPSAVRLLSGTNEFDRLGDARIRPPMTGQLGS
jgi:hypothetical protein